MDQKPCVLVVDDDKAWRDIYVEAFTARNYAVDAVGDFQSALDALDRRFHHVAVVDLKLSEERGNRQGLDVLRRIWALDETLAIIGSGYADVSMYDEFRRMGIFGLTDIPAKARQEFQSIDFYQGQIRKDQPLAQIIDKVEQALAEALPSDSRRRWNASPFGIIRGFSAREVQIRLRSGPMTELRPFLVELVHFVFPWLHARDLQTVLISDDHDTLAFETLCWCRSLGMAVIIRFGGCMGYQRSLEASPIGHNMGLDSFVEEQPLHMVTSERFQGAVYAVKDLSFAGYFDPPATKKVANSH
jgi:ActR/RegA family two-component response regulator